MSTLFEIMRLALRISACITLAGCTTAQMVSPVGAASSAAYAPVNESVRSGLIKFLNDGADFVVQQRREDAYKQMHAACNGKYKIDAEGPREKGGLVYIEPGMTRGTVTASNYTSEYWYIQFSCVRQ